MIESTGKCPDCERRWTISNSKNIDGKACCPECAEDFVYRVLLSDANTEVQYPKPEEITLRDRFAMAALSGILADWEDFAPSNVADLAYNLADAMMDRRIKPSAQHKQ